MPKSTKQKMNTKSTTESEIVGASDYLPDTIWLLRFLEEQGYKVDKCVLMQDNESAIKIEKNGKRSGSKRTRHMDIRYFFIKDRVNSENITIKYCPTESMLADFFKKTLQGALFNKLMGYSPVSSLESIDLKALANLERVEARLLEKTSMESGGRIKHGRSYAETLMSHN